MSYKFRDAIFCSVYVEYAGIIDPNTAVGLKRIILPNLCLDGRLKLTMPDDPQEIEPPTTIDKENRKHFNYYMYE